MQSTNVNPPTKPVATAKIVPSAARGASTSGGYESGQRSVAVNATHGEVSLRYAPINPKSAPKSTR
jgi:hypothetical protein